MERRCVNLCHERNQETIRNRRRRNSWKFVQLCERDFEREQENMTLMKETFDWECACVILLYYVCVCLCTFVYVCVVRMQPSARCEMCQGEQLLVGRRFIDQLRGPPKRPRGAGAMASVLAGPRKAEEDEEEAGNRSDIAVKPDEIYDMRVSYSIIFEYYYIYLFLINLELECNEHTYCEISYW